jgi:hypothetical protein
MSEDDDDRETGARKYPAKTEADASDQLSQEAAENKRPVGGIGLTEPLDDADEKTRHSDGQNPPKRTLRDPQQRGFRVMALQSQKNTPRLQSQGACPVPR